jgi:hypothetical protein
MPSKFSSCVFGDGLLLVFPEAENYYAYLKEYIFPLSGILFSTVLSKIPIASFVLVPNFCNGI